MEILWAASLFFMVMCRLLKVLRASSQKNCSRVLYARSPLLSSKVPRENSFRLFPSKKKFSYVWILSFIYKATHPLWNILVPFFPMCVWIWEAHYVWLTWRFPQVSCLVSDQIPFNLLSICSRMCLSYDLPTFYMQLGFLPKVVICPLSICSPDSFQVSLFGRDLLSLMAPSLMQN